MKTRSAIVVPALMGVAFALRLVLRLFSGEEAYLGGSYILVYGRIATTLVGGGGLCYEPGVGCAVREPLYSLIVAPFVAAGQMYPGLPILQAALGAALVWVTWAIGCELFDSSTARIGAALAAASPYAVVHDTALQETVVANTLLALSVYALLRLRRSGTVWASLGAGLALALSVLTTARVAVLVPCALAWVAWRGGPTVVERLRRAAIVSLPIVLLVGGWVARNWATVGAPVLTTEAGESFWAANNAWTFEFLPDRSIDLAVVASYDRLPDAERRALAALQGQEVARDRLLEQWGWDFVRAHQGQVLWNAVRKAWSPLSATLSPSRGGRLDLIYAAFFTPVHVLALIGLWRARARLRDQSPVFVVFFAFVVTTAAFWAHTSHKSYLDVLLFLYAGSVFGSDGARRLHGSLGH